MLNCVINYIRACYSSFNHSSSRSRSSGVTRWRGTRLQVSGTGVGIRAWPPWTEPGSSEGNWACRPKTVSQTLRYVTRAYRSVFVAVRIGVSVRGAPGFPRSFIYHHDGGFQEAVTFQEFLNKLLDMCGPVWEPPTICPTPNGSDQTTSPAPPVGRTGGSESNTTPAPPSTGTAAPAAEATVT